MGAQFRQLFAIGAVYEIPRPWVMKPTISSPGIGWRSARCGASGYRHLLLPLDRYFTAVLRRVAFLLKLLQRGGVCSSALGLLNCDCRKFTI